jgi:vacuolar-type H+-ATPase subunit E/Vma4
MALADLIARLEQDANGRVAALREQADAEVRAIEGEALRVAGEASDRRLQARRRELEGRLQRELAQARQQARARELAARRALVSRVLARAEALLPEASAAAEYRARLPAHAAETLAYLEGLRPILRCHPSLEPLLAPLKSEDVLLQPDAALGPGVIAEAADGSVRVDNTLLARLRRLERQLTLELLREAEGGAP